VFQTPPWWYIRWSKLCQAFRNPGSWGYAGHFATGFKWFSSELILLNFEVAHLGASGGGVPLLKMSGFSHLWFLELCLTLCNRFQVVTFTADLAQFGEINSSTRCDTANHQFFVQEAIPHDVMAWNIGYFSS